MMKIKLLPIASAIATVLAPMSIHAQTNEETKQAGAEQPVVLTPDMDTTNTDLVFSGYARYGLHYSDDINKYVGAEGQLAGNAAGRLGNEGNGGEFQFTKAFVADNGAIWDVAVMLEHWGDEVGLKKFYAGATNVLESQPNAYLWAGRDFHQRPQQGLNDYFWMSHDGQGAGVYNLEFGGVKLDFSGVAQVEGSGTGDNGNYAFTSKLHGINLAALGELSILANYGFESDQYDEHGNSTNADKIDAFQVAAVVDSSWSMGSTQFILRYAENADTSVFNKTEELTTLYTSFTGNIKTSESWDTEYLIAYHNYEDSLNSSDDRANYSAIIRPMYSWNAVHSTWLEAGYSVVDYANSGENTAWKMTLSQNVSFDVGGARPMLRLYATVGEADNQVTTESYNSKQDTLAIGAMFESWW